jgi:hypothetical protein
LESIEDAEKICKRLNGYEFNPSKHLKAHVHPNSYMRRNDKEHSHHNVFAEMPANQSQNAELAKQISIELEPTKSVTPSLPTPPKSKEKRHTPKNTASSIARQKQRTRELLIRQLQDSPEVPKKISHEEVVKVVMDSLKKADEKNPMISETRTIEPQPSAIIINHNINTYNISVGQNTKEDTEKPKTGGPDMQNNKEDQSKSNTRLMEIPIRSPRRIENEDDAGI